MPVGGIAGVGFVIAGGNAPVLLDSGKEVLDQMAPLVSFPVVGAPLFAVGPGRDDRSGATRLQLSEQAIAVEGFISQQSAKGEVAEQWRRPFPSCLCPGSRRKRTRLPRAVHQRHNLCCQPAAGAANALALRAPFAPAAFW